MTSSSNPNGAAPPPNPEARWFKIVLVCLAFVVLLVLGKALDDYVVNAPDVPAHTGKR